MQPKLKKLVDQGLLWQGNSRSNHHQLYLGSGSDALDDTLGGGWQLGGLHELQRPHHFIEQRVLAPLLKQAVARQQPVFWINPPALVSAAGLAWQLSQQSLHVVVRVNEKEAAWAFEQILQSGTAIAFLWQQQQHIDAATVRRWYKAIQVGRQLAFVLTDIAEQPEAKAYTNRLQFKSEGDRVDVIKRRYGWPVMNVAL